ncbi:TetR/AcrR family transcriptional regulator [Amycolatopsis sp. YIM 10]|uniref:TetR/AcrR family transcriptional regulator n=1 Tax=Amycolatopsis sp. YIM 10 TaxID=2653857 RepID=UPI0012A90049|nr:TetR/AcrR family transcriptional regulator [Amycolatopsis sp. YIM 10]QFU88003.1 hypothetical protein YIM_14085 [Amycolatopsis sp. YIM 10]
MSEPSAPWNIWMRPEWSGRGPKPTYSRAQIADTAVRLADADGIEALSMRKVAAELGTGAMTIYRYVPNKEELLELMIDQCFAGAELPPRTGSWRADISELMRGHRATLLRHPWLSRMTVSRSSAGPNMLRRMEFGMSILDGLGLGTGQVLETFLVLAAWVSGSTDAELAEREARRRSGVDRDAAHAAIAPYVEQVVGSGAYPYFERTVREARFRNPEERFESALKLILDGIEANLPGK